MRSRPPAFGRRLTLALIFLSLNGSSSLLQAVATAGDCVWWEGEASTDHNFSNRHFSPSWLKRKEGLSGSDWLNNGGPRGAEDVFAKFNVQVPTDGRYQFWTRKFWKHGPFKWRFDESPWQTCGPDAALSDSFEFQTHICANWVRLGEVELKQGARRFELRLLAQQGESATACFDCFVLTQHPFTPRGKLKPGEKSGNAPSGWWAFEPDHDPFKNDALLDLRSLNEKEAGASGFIMADGDGFKSGDGKPVRFWAVNAGPDIVNLSQAQTDYLAARLAKCGVNMIRFHGPIFDPRAGDPEQVDRAILEHLHYFIAAMKKQGIYAKLSFYFPLWFEIEPNYDIPGYDQIENKKPFSLLYFNPRMQTIYKTWAKTLLTTNNPHTGLPPARDPAVGIVEIVNEDSYLFWTFSEKNLPEPQLALLEKQFGTWLGKRYGTFQQATEAWSGARHKRDDLTAGRAGLFDAWHMTPKGWAQGGPQMRKRISDQVRFLVEAQRGFYEQMKKYFSATLGVRCPISASNWKTADPLTLDALERYTYAVCDVIDRHGYFGGPHQGTRASYAVSSGDTFKDQAGVLDPLGTPLQVIQCTGLPHVISELGWTMPNRLRADNTFLCSSYGSLQGIDGLFFFALNGPAWTSTPVKFPVSVPSVLGQFPAAALQYRRGDVLEGKPVIHQVLDLEDLYALKGAGGAEAMNLDALRAADLPSGGQAEGRLVNAIDPFACFVGPVTRDFKPGTERSWSTDLTPYIDRKAKTITSLNAQLKWNYGVGLVTVNTPRSQGATGFLSKAGPVKLRDVTIEAQNEYATVHVISLDDAPLASSRKILIQAFAEERSFGWKVSPEGQIEDLGAAPLNVKNIEATVLLPSAGNIVNVKALDPHGYPQAEIKAERRPQGWAVPLPKDALYTIVAR